MPHLNALYLNLFEGKFFLSSKMEGDKSVQRPPDCIIPPAKTLQLGKKCWLTNKSSPRPTPWKSDHQKSYSGFSTEEQADSDHGQAISYNFEKVDITLGHKCLREICREIRRNKLCLGEKPGRRRGRVSAKRKRRPMGHARQRQRQRQGKGKGKGKGKKCWRSVPDSSRWRTKLKSFWAKI